jgi:hypothetical protein
VDQGRPREGSEKEAADHRGMMSQREMNTQDRLLVVLGIVGPVNVGIILMYLGLYRIWFLYDSNISVTLLGFVMFVVGSVMITMGYDLKVEETSCTTN